uniref:Ferredoxin n=1 Tax=uncultured marine group II/III euryarchaeote KM3_195_B08 TaxID=1457970 RepID=A0A075GRY5_9EURY|nr:hypothetical protein [uncultured marine group II/III euryarchaeote KM3_195_B08]
MGIKVIHERNICIGCAACAAVCPSHWEMADDGKSDLIGHTDNTNDIQSKEVDQTQFDGNMEAAKSCPVNCIHVEKDGERLI